tara:strand:+ start:4455 stop:5597 length:1143 start_codon:yes stop_codon:yes gene_type:complete
MSNQTPNLNLPTQSKGMGDQLVSTNNPRVQSYAKNSSNAQLTNLPGVTQLLPGAVGTPPTPVPYGITSGLSSSGLGPKELNTAISKEHANKVDESISSATKGAIKAQSKSSTLPFISNSHASNLSDMSTSPEFINMMRKATEKIQGQSGLSNDLIKSIKNMGKKPTGAHKHLAKSIATENTINKASNKLIGANKNFYKTIALQCPNYMNNQVCKDYSNMQKELLDNKFEEIYFENYRMQFKIREAIKLNDEEKMAVLRLEELLAVRMEELSKLENEINKLNTNISVNTRSNFYNIEVKDKNREWQRYIIYIYYELFLFYIIISNFFPEKYYKKKVPVILSLLYLAFPFLMKYLTIIFQYIYIKISKNFNSYPRRVKTVID